MKVLCQPFYLQWHVGSWRNALTRAVSISFPQNLWDGFSWRHWMRLGHTVALAPVFSSLLPHLPKITSCPTWSTNLLMNSFQMTDEKWHYFGEFIKTTIMVEWWCSPKSSQVSQNLWMWPYLENGLGRWNFKDFKVRSSWSLPVGPKTDDKCLCRKRKSKQKRRNAHGKVRWRQRQRPAWCCHRPGSTRTCRRREETKGFSPGALRGVWSCDHLMADFWLSEFQENKFLLLEAITFVVICNSSTGKVTLQFIS